MSGPADAGRDGGPSAPTGTAGAGRRRTRPTRGQAVLVLLLLGLLALGVAALPWAQATVRTVIADRAISVSGSRADSVTSGVSLVILAAGLAASLGGRWVTRAAAVVAGASGVAYASAAVVFVLDPAPSLLAAAAEVSGVPEIAGEGHLTPWPYLGVVVGVLVLVTAYVLARIPAASAGRRFERGAAAPAARPPARDERTRAMDDWDALERGEDPSARDDG